MFFFVIAKLFEGKPLQFLQEMRRYQKNSLEAAEILNLFDAKGQHALAEGNRTILDSFHKLILKILTAIGEE